MKHVFFVHSHITYLVSRAVIRERGLDAREVLFVCARNYVPPRDEHARLDFPERRWVITWRLRQWFEQHRELARLVDRVAGGSDFVWYLPHTAFPFFRAFIAHPRCKGFHLIEEGMGAYLTREAIGPVMRDLVASRPGWRGRVLRLWVRVKPPVFADPRYLTAYGCTDDAFPGYPRRCTVDIAGLLPRPAEVIEAVLVFDGLLEAQVVTEESFFRCVQALVSHLSGEGRHTVFYKLHPVQYGDARYTPRLRRLLQDNPQGVRFVELASDFCLESLAAAGRTDFYVFLSSVAIYAAAGGCRVYSVSDRLAAMDPTYKAAAKDLPEPVRRRMVFL